MKNGLTDEQVKLADAEGVAFCERPFMHNCVWHPLWYFAATARYLAQKLEAIIVRKHDETGPQ
jgi:hypothetical protein